MTLKSKFILWSTLLLAGVVLIGSLSIWNLTTLWRSARATSAEYAAMDRAEALAVQVAWLRDSLRGAQTATYRDVKYFTPIRAEVTEIVRELTLAARVDDGDASAELDHARSANTHLDAALTHTDGSPTADAAKLAAAELDQLRQTLLAVSKLAPPPPAATSPPPPMACSIAWSGPASGSYWSC